MTSRARRLFLRVANKILADDRLMIALEHSTYHLSLPSLSEPVTFSDFIQRRKLYDRDQRLPVFSDKVRAKQQVAELLGGDWIIPSLWVGVSASDIPFDELPPRFVLKANHGSNMNFIADHGRNIDREAVRQLASRWLKRDFGHHHREWAYTQIPRQLLVEPLVGEQGESLTDYKFYVFGGEVAFIDVQLGRCSGHGETSAIMDASWRRLPFRYGPRPAHSVDPAAPASLPQMVSAARKIGGLFDFVRVDLYDVAGHPYFGETTFYPSAGLARFSPQHYDERFGLLIARLNWPAPVRSAIMEEATS